MTAPRLFGIDYQFLSCGAVFTDGLQHAAEDLGLTYTHAAWDAPNLPQQIARFAPDLLFVVHGRKFCQTHGQILKDYHSAIWLLDEPYEVDDTSRFSPSFDHVFVNDAATLGRHPHASYLPVCYDPRIYHAGGVRRTDAVGFIGGGNPTRDRYLGALARAGLLTYVVGGVFGDPDVNAVSRGRNIPALATADLYRQTRIVLNVFRQVHHYNRDQIAATALNPRVYEALACGALVVSEWRPEIDQVVPELPTCRTEAEAVLLVAELLRDPGRWETLQLACAARLAGHTYAARLQTVLTVALGQRDTAVA